MYNFPLLTVLKGVLTRAPLSDGGKQLSELRINIDLSLADSEENNDPDLTATASCTSVDTDPKEANGLTATASGTAVDSERANDLIFTATDSDTPMWPVNSKETKALSTPGDSEEINDMVLGATDFNGEPRDILRATGELMRSAYSYAMQVSSYDTPNGNAPSAGDQKSICMPLAHFAPSPTILSSTIAHGSGPVLSGTYFQPSSPFLPDLPPKRRKKEPSCLKCGKEFPECKGGRRRKACRNKCQHCKRIECIGLCRE